MISTSHDSKHTLDLVESYYRYLLEGNFVEMEKCLHNTVSFISPLVETTDKTTIVEAAKNLSAALEDIEIRSKFTSGNQVMLAYDFFFPTPTGKLRAAALIECKDQLISKIELFFDGSLLEEKKDTIFSNSESSKKD